MKDYRNRADPSAALRVTRFLFSLDCNRCTVIGKIPRAHCAASHRHRGMTRSHRWTAPPRLCRTDCGMRLPKGSPFKGSCRRRRLRGEGREFAAHLRWCTQNPLASPLRHAFGVPPPLERGGFGACAYFDAPQFTARKKSRAPFGARLYGFWESARLSTCRRRHRRRLLRQRWRRPWPDRACRRRGTRSSARTRRRTRRSQARSG